MVLLPSNSLCDLPCQAGQSASHPCLTRASSCLVVSLPRLTLDSNARTRREARRVEPLTPLSDNPRSSRWLRGQPRSSNPHRFCGSQALMTLCSAQSSRPHCCDCCVLPARPSRRCDTSRGDIVGQRVEGCDRSQSRALTRPSRGL